jgi:hypothetical protein
MERLRPEPGDDESTQHGPASAAQRKQAQRQRASQSSLVAVQAFNESEATRKRAAREKQHALKKQRIMASAADVASAATAATSATAAAATSAIAAITTTDAATVSAAAAAACTADAATVAITPQPSLLDTTSLASAAAADTAAVAAIPAADAAITTAAPRMAAAEQPAIPTSAVASSSLTAASTAAITTTNAATASAPATSPLTGPLPVKPLTAALGALQHLTSCGPRTWDYDDSVRIPNGVLRCHGKIVAHDHATFGNRCRIRSDSRMAEASPLCSGALFCDFHGGMARTRYYAGLSNQGALFDADGFDADGRDMGGYNRIGYNRADWHANCFRGGWQNTLRRRLAVISRLGSRAPQDAHTFEDSHHGCDGVRAGTSCYMCLAIRLSLMPPNDQGLIEWDSSESLNMQSARAFASDPIRVRAVLRVCREFHYRGVGDPESRDHRWIVDRVDFGVRLCIDVGRLMPRQRAATPANWASAAADDGSGDGSGDGGGGGDPYAFAHTEAESFTHAWDGVCDDSEDADVFGVV